MPQGSQNHSYWRSLAELSGDPQFEGFLKAEFPHAADLTGLNRRRWLQLMGASLALAAATGCRWEKEEFRPFAVRPLNRLPGVPKRYATAMDLGGMAIGLHVTSYDGRPIKVEGNPKHPHSQGATDVFAQASILELYDPERNRPLRRQGPQGTTHHTWEEFAAFVRGLLADIRGNGAKGLAILSPASSSPTLAGLRKRLTTELPNARWYEFESVSYDNLRDGARQAFGEPWRTQLDLAPAQVIVTLDADLLSQYPAAMRHARDFSQGRTAVAGKMNRLYAIEPCYSLTGAMADHRLPLSSGDVAAFAAALEEAVNALLSGKTPAPDPSPHFPFLMAVAKDLVAHSGRCVAVAGPRQPADVHATLHRLNAMLGNVGKTVSYTADPHPERPSHVEALRALAQTMQTGDVQTLVVLGGNPAYDAPGDLKFAEALKSVPTSIHLGLYEDETSRLCTWHVPQSHWLESWGDARAWDGAYSICQPLIDPLFGGHSAIELAALLLDERRTPQQLVRETFAAIARQSETEAAWARTLHDGLLAGSAAPIEKPTLLPPAPRKSAPLPNGTWTGPEMEVIFSCDASVYDGRFANNAWLQELPDPLTKLAWDNALLLAPTTAERLGVRHGGVVTVCYRQQTLDAPVFVMPGMAAGCVALPLGYGRTSAGAVGGDLASGVAPVGVNANLLRHSQAVDFDGRLTLELTDRTVELATTQDHHAIDTVGQNATQQRAEVLARQATLEHYHAHPDFAQHMVHQPPLFSLWEEHQYQGRRWGMAIDLSRCVGCNACMVACQAENNVPVVGKTQVLRGREMHWLRVDRYFQGPPEAPGVIHQPVACQQCEMAPCEQVCPVAATVHSQEGLNDMVYNRCVGTRYCSNNCPYKVRRFNYLNFHKDLDDPANEVKKMAYNPEVTVRMRGVMEKCTYCVQRIQAAKILAKNRRRDLADGEIRTACQQVCPTQAIVFGDLSLPDSGVAAAHKSDRAYGMLGEMNFRPRTAYLARIRNPNPELEGPVA